jgi:acetyltransferase-like isoleucine patch superfamily enzyme
VAPLRAVFQWLVRAYSVRQNVVLGRRVHVGLGSTLWAPHRLVVADDVYIGKRCTIECDGVIGAGSMIANDVGLIGRYDHDIHRIGQRVALAPWIGDSEYGGRGEGLEVVVGEDAWIGFAAMVLSDVTIGRGAIVGAGAVVTRDVAPYAIVAGNPARQVGSRFTPEQVAEHERLIAGSGAGHGAGVARTSRASGIT